MRECDSGSSFTFIKVKGQWQYLYRAVDSAGSPLDFLLSAKRDARAAERFFRKVLNASQTQPPRVILFLRQNLTSVFPWSIVSVFIFSPFKNLLSGTITTEAF
jgi:hypothetical protein